MTLTLTPPAVRVPTLEPYRHAVLAVLQSDLAQALNLIKQQYSQIPLELPEPQEYNEKVVNDYSLPQVWPYLSVFSLAYSNREPTQQGWSGQWQGQIVIRLFVEHADGDALTTSLERYAAAIWLVLVNADLNNSLAGATLEYGSEEIEPDPSGGTENQRAVEVRFNLWFRV